MQLRWPDSFTFKFWVIPQSTIRYNLFIPTTAATTEKSEVKLRGNITNLLKKTSTTNKDVLCVLASVVDLLMEQKNELQVVLDEIKYIQQLKTERIENLETKVAQLQQEIIELKAGVVNHNFTSTSTEITEKLPSEQCSLISELHERNIRSRNIMIFNMGESSSGTVSDRIIHDKEHVASLLNKLGLQSDMELKVLRIGKLGTNPRPAKVIFPDPKHAIDCIKNRHKIGSSNIRIKQDLTILQRKQLKCLYEELHKRKSNGEENIAVRYKDGIPFIGKILPPRSNAQIPDDSKNC